MQESWNEISQSEESLSEETPALFQGEEIATLEAPSIDWGAARSYFEELFKSEPSHKDIVALANSLIEMYPADAEALTALVELPGYFSAQRALDQLRDEEHSRRNFTYEERRAMEKKKKDLLIRLTQNQFLLTDTVVKYAKDRSYLEGFWKSTELFANFKHAEGVMARTRESVLAQASIYQLFEKLDKHPSLSHPSEDAFSAIDLWIAEGEEKQAVQVKGAPKKEEFSVIPATERISFPGVAVHGKEGKQHHYNAYAQDEHDKFCAKLDQYNKTTHQAIEGYLIVIPRDRRDSVTGEPDATLVEEARARLVAH